MIVSWSLVINLGWLEKRYLPTQNETWQGEKEEDLPDDVDEFDAMDTYN